MSWSFNKFSCWMALSRKVVITSHTLPCSYHFPHITLLPGSGGAVMQADLTSMVGGWGGRGLHKRGTQEINVEEGARILLHFLLCCLWICALTLLWHKEARMNPVYHWRKAWLLFYSSAIAYLIFQIPHMPTRKFRQKEIYLTVSQTYWTTRFFFCVIPIKQFYTYAETKPRVKMKQNRVQVIVQAQGTFKLRTQNPGSGHLIYQVSVLT